MIWDLIFFFIGFMLGKAIIGIILEAYTEGDKDGNER